MTEMWQRHAVFLATNSTLSRRQIAERLGKSKSTVSDYLRSVLVNAETKLKTEHDNSRILFISDMHIPYHNKRTLNFLQEMKDKYKPTRIVCLGDEVDNHALSFHDSDPDLFSAGHELSKALPIVAELKAMFPIMDLIDSNHGSLAYRRAKAHGIPRHYIKAYNAVLEVDSGWTWHDDLVIDLPDGQLVYVHHGKTAEAIKTAQLYGMSHVSGHYHEKFGVSYFSTPGKLLWGMNSGCLIDNNSLAFAYNRINPKRPIIGTSLIIDGVPVLEAMPL